MTATKDWVRATADVFESDEAVRVLVDMPGVTADAVEVELDGRVLEVRGRRGEGGFHRRFTVPPGTDGEAVAAELRDGVLHLTVPKPETVRPRRIAVTSA